MVINKTLNGDCLTLTLSGKLDSVTSPLAESEIMALLDGVNTLSLNFTDVFYVSSAGLRVLLSLQKAMTAKGGTMNLTDVCANIMETFEMTGFDGILTVK